MQIIIDSREQASLDFSPYPDVVAVPGALAVGDYAPRGLEHLVAVERKSLPDLISSLTTGRDRFARELARGRGMSLAVVIEGTLEQVRLHQYRSQAKPHAILQSIISWSIKYGCNWWWAGDSAGAAYFTVHYLRQWVRGERERLKLIEKLHGGDCGLV